MNGPSLFLGPAGAGGCGGGGGSVLPVGGHDVHGQRRQRREVVAAPSRGRQSGRAENGRPQALPCARERDWVLARIAEKPDLTLRALLKELADRGLIVNLTVGVWRWVGSACQV